MANERGPNVNLLDLVEPIRSSPLYTSWTESVPPEWFVVNQRAYTLVDQDSLYGSLLYSRNYGRVGSDTISISDAAVLAMTGRYRTAGESFFEPAETVATTRNYVRAAVDSLDVPTEETRSQRNQGVLVQPMVHDYP